MEVKEIRMADIRVSESNIRKDLEAGTEDAGLAELAESIREKGLLSPLLVRRLGDRSYELVAGQRRFLACKRLEWKTVSAIIRDVADDTDATILSLIENVHRADLHPLDKAKAYRTIYERYSDYTRVAKETGVSPATVKKYLSLLKLATSIQDRMTTAEGAASIGTLARVADTFEEEEQEDVLDRIGGFKQQIQLEIIKRSDGDVEKLDELREQALEGAFDARLCKGIDDCQFIPHELRQPVKDAVEAFEEKESFKGAVKKLKH